LPANSARGDPGDLVSSLSAQIPQTHLEFLDSLMQRDGITEEQGERGRRDTDDLAAGIDPSWIEPLLNAAFKHRIALIASALHPACLPRRAGPCQRHADRGAGRLGQSRAPSARSRR
jgi:hypothetical protein